MLVFIIQNCYLGGCLLLFTGRQALEARCFQEMPPMTQTARIASTRVTCMGDKVLFARDGDLTSAPSFNVPVGYPDLLGHTKRPKSGQTLFSATSTAARGLPELSSALSQALVAACRSNKHIDHERHGLIPPGHVTQHQHQHQQRSRWNLPLAHQH